MKPITITRYQDVQGGEHKTARSALRTNVALALSELLHAHDENEDEFGFLVQPEKMAKDTKRLTVLRDAITELLKEV